MIILQNRLRTLFVAICFALIVSPAFSEEAKKQEETVEVKAADLTLNVPKAWKQQQPSNNLRLAQFVVPAAAEGVEAAELVISGPFGGSAAQNIQRWLGQFDSKGREVKMTQGTSSQGKYILVDISGTYNRSIGPPIRRQTESVEGFRVINVMLSVENGRGGNYFLKLTGPSETVATAGALLRASFGADADKETAYEF